MLQLPCGARPSRRLWQPRIRSSTLEDQLAFVHHELTAGLERAAGDRLKQAKSAGDAGEVVSRYYERPADADGEASRRALAANLEAWGALKGVYRKDATAADGFATFNGSAGDIPAGWGLVRSDGVKYTVSASASIGVGGAVQVEATANDTGAAGNCVVGTVMSLASPIPGIQSNGSVSSPFTRGADVEEDDAYRARVLEAYQESPAGGDEADYVRWAKGVAGITRAWVARNGFGAGTVVVYAMLDLANAGSGGFPIGTDGVATAETRSAVKATGDQLRVANALYDVQPVTALVYAVSAIRDNINFTISGLTGASAATKQAIAAAISDVFFRNGAPGGTVNLSDIESAIGAVPGTAGFVIMSPTGNITSATGHLPVLGTVTYI